MTDDKNSAKPPVAEPAPPARETGAEDAAPTGTPMAGKGAAGGSGMTGGAGATGTGAGTGTGVPVPPGLGSEKR
jgi:hypothetical protein